MRLALIVALYVLIANSDGQSVKVSQVERNFFRRIVAINIDDVLTNKRLLSRYIQCLLRMGRCTPEVRDFRIVLPRILKHLCNKCTEQEKSSLKKIFKYVRTKMPDDWSRLEQMYDPKGEYSDRLEQFMSNNNSVN